MLKCPRCGSMDKMIIAATADVEVDGITEYVEDHDGFSWHENSICVCSRCYHEAWVRAFKYDPSYQSAHRKVRRSRAKRLFSFGGNKWKHKIDVLPF